MDAPTPNHMPKKIDFKCNNQDYSLILNLETNLKISIKCIERRQLYEKEFSYDEITKINRYFLICESINDVFEEFSNHINSETKIDFENNSLILKLFLPNQKNREAVFVLNLKKLTLEEEVKYLNEKLEKQEKIINAQEEDIKL